MPGRSCASSGSRRRSACCRAGSSTGARTRPSSPGRYGPLALYRQQVEDAGFRLTVIEDNPPMDRLRLGLPGREEELEHGARADPRDGAARDRGVVLQLDGRSCSWSRTSPALAGPRRGRGHGVRRVGVGRRGDAARARPVAEELLWETLAWFLERVVPVAEEAGVRLALHPDDPPLSPVRGIGRIITLARGLRPRLRAAAEPRERDDDVPGQRRADDRRPPGGDPPLRRSGPDPLRPLPRRPRHARAASWRRSSTRARPTWPRASAPTSRPASTRRCAPTTRRRSPGDTAAVPGYPTLGRLHAIGYVQGLLAATA